MLTIENSRSGNEMVAALGAAGYGRAVGPGVYDVHSPVVPPVEFIKDKIRWGFLDCIGSLDRGGSDQQQTLSRRAGEGKDRTAEWWRE